MAAQKGRVAPRAADISTAQYEDGLVDFNTVISTPKSLGGGWDVRDG